jgi:hypothetical protein
MDDLTLLVGPVILQLRSAAANILILLQVPVMCAMTIKFLVNDLFVGIMMGEPMIKDPVRVVTEAVTVTIPKWIAGRIRAVVRVCIRVAVGIVAAGLVVSRVQTTVETPQQHKADDCDCEVLHGSVLSLLLYPREEQSCQGTVAALPFFM